MTTLLKDLISIPERVHKGDFVLKLSEGVDHAEQTLRDYVVTKQLEDSFDQALGLIRSAVEARSSKAAYLHGSFGSGKSHFMAVLYLLLQHHKVARSVPELQGLVEKHDPWLQGRKFLLVPYHLIGATNLESAILGGYAKHVAKLHPEAPPPAVYMAASLLDDARGLREKMGDDSFFDRLGGGTGGGSGWGELEAGWDAGSFERAATDPGSEEAKRLAGDLIRAYFGGYEKMAAGSGEGFVPLDDGLAAISRHAEALGYDGLILFLDELILWLASHAADVEFLQREGQKLSKVVEATGKRPIPIISFVARQRDLRELVGEHVPGAERLGFGDVLQWWEGRFDRVVLENRNLPVIIQKRLLRPRDEAARQTLDGAFQETTRARNEILQILQGPNTDRGGFREVYPFSPALLEILVAVSSVLQRERTALKLLLQLLVDQRETLAVGDLVPVGDLWDVLEEGNEPFTEDMRRHFLAARKLWREKLKPILEREAGLQAGEEIAPDDPKARTLRNDSRLLKTLLLASLAPEAESLKGMTAGRLAALNHGTLRSPIPGQEPAIVLRKLRKWATEAGEIRISEDAADPTITLQVTGIDVESILAKAQGEDNQGNQRQLLKQRLFQLLGIDIHDSLFTEHRFRFRGTDRKVDVVFGNVRELPDESLRASRDGWKLVIDYPFDRGGQPTDDLERLRQFPETSRTLCWLPSFFSATSLRDLGRSVILEHVLAGERFAQYAAHLAPADQQQARVQLENQRNQLRQRLDQCMEAAYGVRTPEKGQLDASYDVEDHFQSLEPSFRPRPPAGPTMSAALEQLLEQTMEWEYPLHPHFQVDKIRPVDLGRVYEEVEKAIAAQDRRIRVEDRRTRELLQTIADPLKLGEMTEAHFLVSDYWRNHLEKHSHDAGGEMTIRKLRGFLDLPKARGLPREIQDLVLRLFATQTNRSFHLHGGPFNVGAKGELLDELVLVDQPLPAAQSWETAKKRAAAWFGITLLSSARNAANVSELATQLKAQAEAKAGPAQELVPALTAALAKIEQVDSHPARLRTAEAAARLLRKLQEKAKPEDRVEVLAAIELPSTEQALRRSIDTAKEVIAALEVVHWEAFSGAWRLASAAADGNRDRVREILEEDEIAIALAPALREAERQAIQLLSITKAPAPPSPAGATTASPPPASSPAQVSPPSKGWRRVDEGSEELSGERITSRLDELGRRAARDGRRLQLSWRIEERES